MNKIDMATELFVRTPGEIVPLPEMEAEKMRKAVLSAQDVDTVMSILEEGMMSKYLKAGRFNEMLDIIDELHVRPFMDPAATCLYLKQGSICESMSDYSLAIDYYSLGIQAFAIKVEPEDRFGYWLFNNSSFCLGETYYYCGHFDKAVCSYEKFYAVAPSGYTGCLEYVQKRVKELKELKLIETQFK